ncbi:MAG TPA: flagellar basal-body MS-ring/collar protein FliF [Stellaceae bacterium]|nr:flagellar basal-body MS-ring/collar protein FliF [Stellaceae bacterium]
MNGLIQTLRGLGPTRLVAIGGVAVAMIAFFAFLTTRIATPGMSLLYGDLDLRDSGQIIQKLEAMGIPYQLKGDGAQILVPSDQVARLRMSVAEAGLPHGGSVGYELFDKSEGLGTSSLVQDINHVRALEGELARTITSISLIQSARVHLVLPRRELFSRDRQEPSAAVLIKMRGAERLGKPQVAAIQHLVASSVPGLKPTRVSIADGEGNLLARGDGDPTTGGEGTTAEEMRVNYETRLSRNVEELLERSVGPGKARVDVHADMDFDRITTNSEAFDPDGQVVRSTQTVKESSNSSDSGDQPVTVTTNLPNQQSPATSSGGRSQSARTEETTNYDITKTITSKIREAGIVRRQSVAVLVDGTYTQAADGTRTYQPRSPEELKQLTTLVRSAIGFDEKRGDTAEVINMRFIGADEVLPPPPLSVLGFEKADLLRIAEMLVVAVVAVLFILLVVRPLLTRVLENLGSASGEEAENLLPGGLAGPGAPALPAPAGLMPAIGAGHGGALAAPGGAGDASVENMIDIGQVDGRVAASSIRKIGEIVEKHPEEAVAIIRSWMYQGA